MLYAADGASAEAIYRASGLEIDALVACADMKRMCGVELARRVRRTRPAVRVLLMWRPFAGSDEARRAYLRGYAVIEEPFTPDELCDRLLGLLATPRSEARAEPRLDGEPVLPARGRNALARFQHTDPIA